MQHFLHLYQLLDVKRKGNRQLQVPLNHQGGFGEGEKNAIAITNLAQAGGGEKKKKGPFTAVQKRGGTFSVSVTMTTKRGGRGRTSKYDYRWLHFQKLGARGKGGGRESSRRPGLPKNVTLSSIRKGGEKEKQGEEVGGEKRTSCGFVPKKKKKGRRRTIPPTYSIFTAG